MHSCINHLVNSGGKTNKNLRTFVINCQILSMVTLLMRILLMLFYYYIIIIGVYLNWTRAYTTFPLCEQHGHPIILLSITEEGSSLVHWKRLWILNLYPPPHSYLPFASWKPYPFIHSCKNTMPVNIVDFTLQ